MSLTEKRIRDLRPGPTTAILWDGEIKGFGVRMTPAGAKAYVLDYRIGQRQRRATLGRCSDMALRTAREKAGEWRNAILEGHDPLEARRAAPAAPPNSHRPAAGVKTNLKTLDKSIQAFLEEARNREQELERREQAVERREQAIEDYDAYHKRLRKLERREAAVAKILDAGPARASLDTSREGWADPIVIRTEALGGATQGIYRLIRSGETVYIGKSTCCASRVLSHIAEGKKEFDSYTWAAVPGREVILAVVEALLIHRYAPRYNHINRVARDPFQRIPRDQAKDVRAAVEKILAKLEGRAHE